MLLYAHQNKHQLLQHYHLFSKTFHISLYPHELNKDIELSWETPERKIHINNLIKLLNILIEEGQNDPLAGKILLESEMLLTFLKKSPKKNKIISLIKKHFKVLKTIEEEKDRIYII